MKKIIVCFVILYAFSIVLPLSIKAASPTDFCDLKKMAECENKIDSLIASIDALRAKLVKARIELKGGKKLTNEEADRLTNRMDQIQKSLPSTEGNIWDY